MFESLSEPKAIGDERPGSFGGAWAFWGKGLGFVSQLPRWEPLQLPRCAWSSLAWPVVP